MNRRKFNQATLSILLATIGAPLARAAARTLNSSSARAARLAAPPLRPMRPDGHVINVRHHGARGDGKTNDTEAFQGAAAEINRLGGGILYIPSGTYKVGKQRFAGATGKGYAYDALPVIALHNCAHPVVITGEHGTRLVADRHLRFGAFHPVTGEPYHPPGMPFTEADYRAEAYTMIDVSNSADVSIMNLELDGNIMELALGGAHGDTGRQLHATGIYASGIKKLTIKNIYTHHHGLDGLQIAYPGLKDGDPPTPVVLQDVISEFNARQGLSWVGGIGLAASHCRFNHTGRARFSSSPGAGLDIEAEHSINRNGTFTDCEFANNIGCGIVADSGDSAHMTFDHCQIWGIHNWSLWPRKPYLTFRNCAIHGAMVHPYADAANPAASSHFINCSLDDAVHPKYGPSYLDSHILINMGGDAGSGVVFEGCRITVMHSKSFYTDHPGSSHPIIIQNTQITHGWAPPTPDFVCLLRGAFLKNVHFKEMLPRQSRNHYTITAEKTTIGPDVIVDGPIVTITAKPGIGRIKEGFV